MKKLFLTSFVASLVFALTFCFNPTKVFASGDTITPALLDLTFNPGDSISVDILFSSAGGGIYDVYLKQFKYSEKSEEQYFDVEPGLHSFQLSETEFSLNAEEEKIITLKGKISDEYPKKDDYFAFFVEKRALPGQRANFRLGSLMFFRIGEREGRKASIVSKDLIPAENPAELSLIRLTVEHENNFYYPVRPILHLKQEDTIVKTIKGDYQRLFPHASQRTIDLLLFDEKNFNFTNYGNLSGEIILEADNQEMLDTQNITFSDFKVFKAHQKTPVSAASEKLQFTRAKIFTWTETLFYFFLSIIGLCFIWFSFYSSKR